MVLFETTVFAKQPCLGIFYACKLTSIYSKDFEFTCLRCVCIHIVWLFIWFLSSCWLFYYGGLGTLNSVGTAFQFNLFFEGLVNWLLSKCSPQSLQLVLR